MSTLDMIVKNGKIVDSHRVYKADLGIKDGRFVLIGDAGVFPGASRVVDTKNQFVLPGLVDSHVNVREPGLTEKEDFRSGTMAAAAGGVTTVICMPTTSPPTTTEKAFVDKVRLGESKAIVDFALEAGVDPRRLDELPTMARHGCVSYEVFLMNAPSNMVLKDDATLWRVLGAIANVHGLAGVYCGDQALKDLLTDEIKRGGRRDSLAHADSEPSVLEVLGISRVLALALELGTRVHFRQLSGREGVKVIAVAKGMHPGQKITVEVTPHHLLLTRDEMIRQGPHAKMYPPLRTQDDIASLWQAIADGEIDIVGSDHAPHLKEEKALGLENIWEGPSGIPGVQTLLPLMLNEVNRGRLSLTKLVELCSENPARIFGLHPCKGTISVGSDADFVVVDMNQEEVIRSENQYSKAHFTPFNGWKVKGVPTLTVVRGRIVMENGRVTIREPWGRFIRSIRASEDGTA